MWRGSPSCRFESDSAHQITVISGYYGVDASIRLNINLTPRSRFYAYWKHPYYLPHWTDEIDNFRLELSLLFRSQVIYNHALERFGYCYPTFRTLVVEIKSCSSPCIVRLLAITKNYEVSHSSQRSPA